MRRLSFVLLAATGLWVACTSPSPRRAPVVASPASTLGTASALPLETGASSSATAIATAPASSAVASESASVAASASTSAAPPKPVCLPQSAQPFLVRASYWPASQHVKEHQRSLRYRTEHYGYVKGFGEASWSATTPKKETVSTRFFGLPVELHRAVVPALACVEAELKVACSATPYTPGALAGLRDRNTYRGGEVTNHLYGIAIDIDPQKNPCCSCVKPWRDSPLCKKKTNDPYARMAMPRCWVDTFEKYGWYWLGHDRLQDTMHFEFLGDPSAIMGVPATRPSSAPSAASSSP